MVTFAAFGFCRLTKAKTKDSTQHTKIQAGRRPTQCQDTKKLDNKNNKKSKKSKKNKKNKKSEKSKKS